MHWYAEVMKKYAVFSGRASRTEYWMFLLCNVLIAFVLGLLEGSLGGRNILNALYSIVVFVPSIAVSIRRLHDIGRSGWWMLIALIPLAGTIILVVFAIEDSEPGENRYGPDPKMAA